MTTTTMPKPSKLLEHGRRWPLSNEPLAKAPAFRQRFNMGHHRFEDILRALVFDLPEEGCEGDEDSYGEKWIAVRRFAYNSGVYKGGGGGGGSPLPMTPPRSFKFRFKINGICRMRAPLRASTFSRSIPAVFYRMRMRRSCNFQASDRCRARKTV